MADAAQKLGQYTLLEKIAQGGMAQLFKAKTVDPNGFERLVVIKRILPHISADPEYVEMLVDEAKIAVNFNHGNIAQIYDLGRFNNDYFIVMEYVDGKTMSQIGKRLKEFHRPIPIDILLYCAIEICHGLSYIHNKKDGDGRSMGVVHRDISPQNIILSYSGNIKIIDFGVAKARVKTGKTESGVLKGKFAYMSPEQARSDTIDSRSDVFSMGILLWEFATGERLFKRKTNHETIQAIQKAKYDAPSTIRKNLPRAYDKVVKRALQKHPKHRYQDAADMAVDLEKLLYEINPDFKPVFAAEFIYKLFGPESDEKDLPNPIFVQEKTPITVLQDASVRKNKQNLDDPTIKDHLGDHATPVVKIVPFKKFSSQALWVAGFCAFLMACLLTYVLVSKKINRATFELKGFETGMHVFLDGTELINPNQKNEVASDKQHSLRVHQDGAKDFTLKFLLKPYEHRVIPIELKREVPLFGNLIISTKPTGATVYLDNIEWKSKSPVIIRNLDAKKTYKVGLFMQKYRFYTESVTIIGGQDTAIEHDFEESFAYLSVTSNPIGAEVLIDGVMVGTTPYQNPNVNPDAQLNIEIRKQDYKPAQTSLKLAPGEDKTLNFELDVLTEVPQSGGDGDDLVFPR